MNLFLFLYDLMAYFIFFLLHYVKSIRIKIWTHKMYKCYWAAKIKYFILTWWLCVNSEIYRRRLLNKTKIHPNRKLSVILLEIWGYYTFWISLKSVFTSKFFWSLIGFFLTNSFVILYCNHRLDHCRIWNTKI